MLDDNSSSESFLQLQQQQLDAMKKEMAQALLQFSNVMGDSLLADVVKSSSLIFNEDQEGESGASLYLYKCQVDYVRNFLQFVKIFPLDIRLELGCNILRDCDILLKETFQESWAKGKLQCGSTERSGEKHYYASAAAQQVATFLLPTAQLIHDCIEMILATMKSSESGHELEQLDKLTRYSMNIFGETTRFLLSFAGISLGKPDFLRILGLSQTTWKFSNYLKSLATLEISKISKIIEKHVSDVEETLTGCVVITLLSSENGRSFVRFWCEICNLNDVEKEFKMCKSLQQVSSSSTANSFSEIYMIFTSYFEDASFWKTETGRVLTPALIRSIMADLSSDKAETKKRAAFVLRLLVGQYSHGTSIFDASIPEETLISLNNMERGEYAKFWDSYFDIHDILNETQLHIVQPVLQKLDIFKEHSSNDAVLVWLPILLKKMISHDNRSVVKEGFEQFLQSGQYLKKSGAFRQLAQDFLEKHIMPLIRDHVGWILNEPKDFFKNIRVFGQFMARLYSIQTLPEFKAAEVILEFLTSSGKCMGPHTIFFLVASVDEMLCDNAKNISAQANVAQQQIIVSSMDTLISQLALLLSNNLTTVSKYFRELLDYRCINILSTTIISVINKLPKIELDSFLFMKLLAFFGSITVKVFSEKKTKDQIQKIVEYLNNKEPELFAAIITESKMYRFAKSNLSSSTSVLGMLRFVTISLQISSDKEISDKIEASVENFAVSNCEEELLPGSTQGLCEFLRETAHGAVSNIYAKILNELCVMIVSTDNDLSSLDNFMFCVRRVEVLSILPSKLLSNLTPLLPKLNSISCRAKQFFLQKLYNLICAKTVSLDVFNVLTDITGDSEGFRNFAMVENISDSYFSITERNLFAEYYQVQFCMSTSIIDNLPKTASIDKQVFSNLLHFIVNNIEKCNSKGVAAGLLLAKSVAQVVDYRDHWEGMHLLDEIAGVGWRLVFEQRKSEAFWCSIKSFVEMITCPYFVRNGYLNKYADLLLELGESVSGLPLVLVQYLVKIQYPEELLDEVHQILVKAALAGGPLPKNNRVSFAIWDYLRNEPGASEEENDPENFSSDCKARLLACEKLRSDLEYLFSKGDGQTKALSLLLQSVQSVLERNNQESVQRKRYFQGSSTHRIKQRIGQLLLTLQVYFDFKISKIVLEKVLSSLSTDSPQPSVRYMGEWLIILILKRHPELNTLLFDCLDSCIQKRLGFGAFFSTICLQTSKLLKCPKFYDKALESLATLTLSQHLTVRIYAQIAFQKIYTRVLEHSFVDVTEKYAPILSALERASTFVSGNCSKLLDNVSQDFYVNIFDSVTHYCPEVIFTLLPRLSGMIRDECILQPRTIRKLVQIPVGKPEGDVEKIYMDHEKSAWHLKSVVADGRELGEELPSRVPSLDLTPQQSQNNEMNYQKKINPWKLLSVSEELEEYSNTITKKKCVGEEGLIVVASLLDHLPNLGGLCRTCEIFGVHKYVVNSLKIVNDQHFQSLSVSAQNWVNILEVPARDLESFLFTYSAKGYTILGVEQANESSSLKDLTFPKKSVLLLGNEKLGIPPELLRLVDRVVEIPQVGIIRSLNVHVTGALCIWQYASQNVFGPS